MKKQLLLLILTLSSLAILRGQPITVETLVAPPYAANVSDYLDQNVLKITNSSNAPISIMLKGTLTSDIGINGKTKDVYKPSRPIVVPANNVPLIIQSTKQSGNDFFDTKNVEYNTGPYSLAEIVRTGIVPEGNYTLCITAHDYTTGELKSKTDGGINCRAFNIIIPQPPTIDCDANVPMLNGIQSLAVGAALPAGVAPQPPVSIRFSWLPTNTNGRALIVAYDLYLLKLVDGQNGQDALLAAIRNKQNNPIKFENIRTPQYNAILATTPSLVTGKYAWAVVAKDGGGGNTPFQNNGISQVCEFEWKKPDVAVVVVPPPPAGPRVAIVEPNCDCTLVPPADAASDDALNVGDMVEIGAYTLRINAVQKDPSGGWKGTGNVKLPIIGVKLIPILVDFEKLTFAKIGDKRKAKTGVAMAQKHAGGPSLTPHIVVPDKPKLLDVKPSDLTAYDAYFNRNKNHLLSNLEESAQNSGIQLPFGIDGVDLPTIALVNIVFTPTKAWFDAIAGMEISDEPAPDNWLAFGASGVCLKTDGNNGICGDAQLYLAEDLKVAALNFKLFGAKGQDLKNACHLLIKDSKVDSAFLIGDYSFSKSMIKRADDGAEDVKALMKFRARSWSQWYATVEMPDFKVTGAEDFKFSPKIAYYDHTDTYNPSGLPADYTEGSSPRWQGFFMPEVKAQLPPVLKKNASTPTDIMVKNFIIDKHGVTIKILGENLIDIRDGNLDGWAFSLDKIDVFILKSTFKYGKMNGKLQLPIAKEGVASALDYDALLAYKNNLLKYTFNIKPKADVEVPIWAARMTFNENSNIKVSNDNAEKKFHAEAHLYGNVSINTHDLDKSFPNFNLVGLKYENLFLKNFKDKTNPKDDYLGLDTFYFVTGFASPQKNAGGFPMAIVSFKFAPEANANATLNIKYKINLCDLKVLPTAEGDISIRGNVGFSPAEQKITVQILPMKVSGLALKGDIGPVNINGTIAFFQGDATYGDGIYGKLSAKILKESEGKYKIDLGTVAAQFGSKDGKNYWFVDAKTTGLEKVIPAVQIYALAGGAYYNMTPTNTPEIRTSALAAPSASAMVLGVSASGTVYKPDFNNKLGFYAGTYLGIIEKTTFNADASLSMEFSLETGGLSRFEFNGAGRFLEPKERETPLAGGRLNVLYNATEQIFSASISVSSNKLPLKQASIFLYFSPQGWHIKVGRPKSVNGGRDVVLVELLPGTNIDAFAYFQVGTFMVDAAPDLPADVLRILTETGVDVAPLKSNRSPDGINPGAAIAFGAGLEAKAGGQFGPIYGNLLAMIGFDLSLMNYGNTTCGNPPLRVGIDGWYAQGQLYAAVEAVLGIKIDLGFFNVDIEILKGQAAAALRGAGPNPFWGVGAMGVRVCVLGIIDGRLNYQFSVGTKCEPGGGDALAAVKVISDAKPSEGSTVDVDEYASGAFNYEIGKEFSIDEYSDAGDVKKGDSKVIPKKTRYFALNKSNIDVTIKNLSTNETIRYQTTTVGSAQTYMPSTLLAPLTEYEMTVEASVTEYINGGATIALRKDKTPFKEIKKVRFKTNKGLETIKADRLTNLNPIWNQRYFIKKEGEEGFIRTNQIYVLESFNVPKDDNLVLSAVARFVKMPQVADGSPTPESPIVLNGEKWEFNLPVLEPNKMYVAQFLIRWKDKRAAAASALSSKKVTSHIQRNDNGFKVADVREGDNNFKISQDSLSGDRLRAGTNEKIVFSINFKTSRFQTFEAKLKALRFREMQVEVTNPAPPKSAWIAVDKAQENVAIDIAQKVKQAINIPMTSSVNYFPVEYNFSTAENFDIVDVNGTQINSYAKIPPLVTFKNREFDWWAAEVLNSVSRALRDAGAGNTFSYIGTDAPSTFMLDAVQALEKIKTFPNPLLTDEEVKGGAGPRLELMTVRSLSGYSPRAMVIMNYKRVSGSMSVSNVNGFLGKFGWAVNPAWSSSLGFAFDAGQSAFGAGLSGLNLGANVGGKSFGAGIMAR
jgi:hypothetical protein